jgi:mono/diheme cytochrome c family protein
MDGTRILLAVVSGVCIYLVAAISGDRTFIGSVAAQTPLERGRYLVETILACGNCHTPKHPTGAAISERNLAGGGLSFMTPAFNATASNITPDLETGIGTWNEEGIKRVLVEGIRPGHGRLPGTAVAAIMPVSFYKALLPQDLDAIVAYLRSVKPVRNEIPNPEYKLPVRHEHYPDADSGFMESDMRDPVKRGAYLVTIGHCMECHSSRVGPNTDYKNGFGKGGRRFGPALVQGFPSVWQGSTAPNITSHPQSGIGAWTDAEIKRAIAQGISRTGRSLQPPMPYAWYAGLSEADLSAIVTWLRTVPPIE